MKRLNDENLGQPNLLQALHKNKMIQSKLTQCEKRFQIQFLKQMEIYTVQEKFNRELLYTWKKEIYVRQQRKFLQQYVEKRHGIPDEYYENQMKNLENIIAGQQSLVVPPVEEEYRLMVNKKYLEFLAKNPVELPPSFKRVEKNSNESMQIEFEEEENHRKIEQTWKYLNAQSAGGRRRRHENLPTIPRSTTAKESTRRILNSTQNLRSARTPNSTSRFGKTDSTLISFSSSSKTFSNSSTLPEGIEPLVIHSETVQKATRADLLSMRSVRRAKKSPTDVNMIYEARKRVYQINRRALDVQMSQRKAGFVYELPTDRSIPMEINENDEQILPKDSFRSHD